MSHLCVSLLGQVRVSVDGAPNDLRLTRGAIALLAYLLLNRHRRFTRNVLATVFWSEHDERHARNCLNTAVWRLRGVLEPRRGMRGLFLVTTPAGEIGFNRQSQYSFDVETFETLACARVAKPPGALSDADIGLLEQAVSLYAGELLEGFYDEWALEERRRIHRVYTEALTRLMRFHAQNGSRDASLAYAQRLLCDDPLREEAHRAVMRAYSDSGQREQALRQYQRCRALLHEELGIPPSSETQRLFAGILSDSPTTPVALADAGFRTAIEQASEALRTLTRRLDETCLELRGVTDLVEELRGRRT